MFINGYEINALTPRKASKLKTPTPRQEMNTIAEVEGNQQEGLQPISVNLVILPSVIKISLFHLHIRSLIPNKFHHSARSWIH